MSIFQAASSASLIGWPKRGLSGKGCTACGPVLPSGIPLGSTGPHAVQPLPDKPRFGQPMSEAELAAWNIDIRTPDGRGLPAGQGSVAEGRKVYEAKCVACHGA